MKKFSEWPGAIGKRAVVLCTRLGVRAPGCACAEVDRESTRDPCHAETCETSIARARVCAYDERGAATPPWGYWPPYCAYNPVRFFCQNHQVLGQKRQG